MPLPAVGGLGGQTAFCGGVGGFFGGADRAAEDHTSSRGLLHGGVIATVADDAVGLRLGVVVEDALALAEGTEI